LQQYTHKNYSRLPDARMQELERLTELGFPHHTDPVWGYLRAVCCLPWSSRMWIAQECLLNANTVMRCGRLEFPWNVLSELQDCVARGFLPKIALTDMTSPHVGILFMSDSGDRNNIGVMTGLSRSANHDFRGLETLRLLLAHCHSLRSTDPRDKIYALLNIAKDAGKLGIMPDYACATEKLYVDVAIRIIRSEKTLDLLADVYPQKSLKLP